ncbi:MAG: GNVR domain-containing protein [Gemmatimonadaceae bacterium]
MAPSTHGSNDGFDSVIEGIPIFQWTKIVVRSTRAIVTLAVALAVIALVYSTLAARGYVASATFVPQTASSDNRLSGLAAQFGINVGGRSGQTESPDFYIALLRSRELLKRAGESEYVLDTVTGKKGNLADVYDIPPGGQRSRTGRAITELSKSLDPRVDPRTGILTLSVGAPKAHLAEQVDARLIELLNDYNVNRRKSQASAQRQFTEARVQEAQANLVAAEDAVKNFMATNRQYQSSPQLMTEVNRLQRRVDLWQQVYTALAQSLEQSRIDEVRDTPVITVIDTPAARKKRIGAGPMKNAIIAFILGILFGIPLAFVREALSRHAASEPVELAELKQMLATLAPRSLRRLFGRQPNREAFSPPTPSDRGSRAPAGRA